MSKPTRLRLSPKQMILLVGILVVTLFLFGYTGRLIASSELQEEVARWEREVRLAEQRVQENQRLLELVKTDQYVIEQAHTELGLAFPDEVAVWVDGEEPVVVPQATPFAGEPAPYWEQWRDRFFEK